MQGVVNFFGRVAILIDQNTQAFHMFMSALLQVSASTCVHIPDQFLKMRGGKMNKLVMSFV